MADSVRSTRAKLDTVDRILFIVPPHTYFDAFIHPAHNARIVHKNGGTFGSVLTDMPLGVLSLSAYLKANAKVETRLIDFNVVLNKLNDFDYSSFAAFFKHFLSGPTWLDYNPTIIGISSLFTPSYANMLDIAQCCRKIFPSAMVVVGGGVPTNMYEDIFRETNSLDAVCYGEGEIPLLELVRAVDKAQCIEEHGYWITKRKIAAKIPFRHSFIENLDEIPLYDYEILNVDDYGLNPAITAYASIKEKKRNFHVMTSRGCVHRCCFCSSHTVHGRKMRYYSLDRIEKDFQSLRDKYGANTFVFQDDHLMSDSQRVYRIIDIVKNLHVTAVFQNGLALYALDKKMLTAMKNAGVNQLLLSIESGSERVLREIMHKPLNLSIAKQVADDCRELEIYTNVNILIGLPGETKRDIEDARTFLKTINANWFLIFCATPLVGSEMFNTCLEKNYLKGDYINCDYKKAIVETEDFTAEYIQETAYDLNLELNFVENADMRLGDHATALKGFENAIRAKNDHALAYYYAAKCHAALGDSKKSSQYEQTARTIFANDSFWRRYAERFGITL